MTTTTVSKKIYFTTPNRFEAFGYHRAVRKGPFIYVSGTTSLNPENGEVEFLGDAAKQAEAAMKRTIDAVERSGGRLEDVCRVRMYVAVPRNLLSLIYILGLKNCHQNHEDCMAIGEVYRKCFGGDGGEVGAAATMIVVKDGFADQNMLVEIEVDAVV